MFQIRRSQGFRHLGVFGGTVKELGYPELQREIELARRLIAASTKQKPITDSEMKVYSILARLVH